MTFLKYVMVAFIVVVIILGMASLAVFIPFVAVSALPWYFGIPTAIASWILFLSIMMWFGDN